MSTDPKEFAAALRVLANMVDAHPEIAGWYMGPGIGQHLNGEKAAALDSFAGLFEAEVEHAVHSDGERFSDVETVMGPLSLRLQCRTEDYEKATGKKIDNVAGFLTKEQLAEVEHWSKTPMPHEKAPAVTE
ncbi:hypothetical protein F9C11_21560 [Amycolatopsis sp. VS8301801F10]|uniref:hypothetical protein n=1 Tax=Amycolatopsis sp. VS8301801F10 TaxID=2652442 RepID=UPI0038FBF7F7